MNILCATSVEQTASFAVVALVDLLQPRWVCLLVWDMDLGRYIVGDTWLSPSNPVNGAEHRRKALRLAEAAHRSDPDHPRQIEENVFYQPLNTASQHVGAWCLGIEEPPDATAEPYTLLLKATTRALYTATRLQQADQERTQLEAERTRLEHLLQAVEQQQRTIDQLLAAERQLSASLEAKVEERTAALRAAQARLIQSEKLAVIGQLASSLAHELNNPLQAIQSGLGLVMNEIDQGSTQRVRNDLTVIQLELERIQAIFRQMLDFYRPVTHEYVPLDLNAICEAVRVLMRKRLQEANLTLRLELTRDLPLTCGDNNQIKQVLLNLIFNAAEAMTPEGGHILLRTGHNGKEVCVNVVDDGPGIPLQHQARLFEPLFTTKTRGLGLGLAISQEIVQRHAGHIAVKSVPGEGTTLTVILPVRETCDDSR